MKESLSKVFKSILLLFNTRAAGIYLVWFSVAIGIATFIENDFGTSSAQKIVYQSWWFELLLLLFGGSIIVAVIKFRMIQQKKWALLTFHTAIIIILLGAGVTRYFGFEGMMHIRENSSSSTFLSAETYLMFEVENSGYQYAFDEQVLFASLGNNSWSQSYLIDGQLIKVEVKDFIPNPKQILYESLDGLPMLKIVIGGTNGREEYFIAQGETKRIRNVIYNFKETIYPGAFNIKYKNDSLLFLTDKPFIQTVMATRQRDTIHSHGVYQPLILRSLYSDGMNSFVFGDFKKKGKVTIESEDLKVRKESMTAIKLAVSVNGETKETFAFGSKGLPGKPQNLHFGDLHLAISYGAKEKALPFSIKLHQFILEKYPGTNSAASYASKVQLIDPQNNVQQDYRIYMNHILNYGGYRFFQSSFDKDEKGTYLSVNHDFWGTLISYIGYALLTIGMILTFFSKRTRFHQLIKRIQKLREQRRTALATFLLLGVCISLQAKSGNPYIHEAVSKEHAAKFSKIVVQDFKGRMKPIHTLSREIMRKLAKKESMYGMTADQILLSLFLNKQGWYATPIIKLGKHGKIKEKLGITGDYAAYKDFFNQKGDYILKNEVRRVYSLDPIDRGTFEKELLKMDEKVNILSMALSGSLLKIVPNPNDPNNTWLASTGTPHNHQHNHGHPHTIAENFFKAYKEALQAGVSTGNFSHAGHLLDELKAYQEQNGGAIMPSNTKIKGEILLNESQIFTRLTFLYTGLGLAFLCCLFLSVFRPNIEMEKAYWALFSIVGVGFIAHTLGLGVRWYVSGRAPWSNGYESMIYIAWTTTLAGVIFTRKSFGGLAATMVLAGTILFVATLSFLDPEITPLVPVLRSYWLTIHVSMIAGSYGFLMLGAIIGIINLLLIIFIQESNKKRIRDIIQEMSYISELTLTGGLFMISIGTYLGGVWANESWGRYWGWDAKETWALVTILVYAFILHMRIIPKMFGLYAYNLATIFGLASVIMTYYGVNYYLSGLHSYAAGDPVPIPIWVYYAVASLTAIGGLAYWKKRRYPLIS